MDMHMYACYGYITAQACTHSLWSRGSRRRGPVLYSVSVRESDMARLGLANVKARHGREQLTTED